MRIHRCYYSAWLCFLSVALFLLMTLFHPARCESDPNKVTSSSDEQPQFEVKCSELRLGQYFCHLPDIDPATQQPKGSLCVAADGLSCLESKNNTFEKEVPCEWTNGYSYETSLLLSVFLGMFGIDRFYLGYHGIGLFKLCTLGCFFIGQLIDIILIATQSLGPADGSHYIISYFGPRLAKYTVDNNTYRLPQDDWGEL